MGLIKITKERAELRALALRRLRELLADSGGADGKHPDGNIAVKVIREYSPEQLEYEINTFIGSHDVVDMQYSTHGVGSSSYYSCMVTYILKDMQ